MYIRINWKTKKTCNKWNEFDPLTYDVFRQLNSDYFIKLIRDIAKVKLISDPWSPWWWLAHSYKQRRA